MTILRMDGFELLGDASTSAANVQARLNVREDVVNTSGLSASLIDDFFTEGFAFRGPVTSSGQSMRLRYELPSALKVTQNASVGTFSIGARVKVPVAASGNILVFGWHTSSGAPNVQFNVDANGEDIKIGTTTVAARALTPGGWAYIEWEFKPTSSANGGYHKIFVDGTEVYDSGPFNVSATFNTAWGFSINVPQLLDGTGDRWIAYDDLVILHLDGTAHSDPLGPRRIYRVPPTEDWSIDWTPSGAGDNYQMVDEVEFDDTDYVSTSTDGDVDAYEHAAFNLGDVEAVSVEAECINTGAGTPTLHVGLDNSSVSEVAGAVTSTVDNTYVRGVFETLPAGGAWSTAQFNNTILRMRYEA